MKITVSAIEKPETETGPMFWPSLLLYVLASRTIIRKQHSLAVSINVEWLTIQLHKVPPDSQVDQMKFSTAAVALIAIGFSAVAIAAARADAGENSLVSVLETAAVKTSIGNQYEVPATAESVIQLTAPAEIQPSVLVGETILPAPTTVMETSFLEQPLTAAPIGNGSCETCCRRRCRGCNPPPVSTVFCLQDPCGCSHEACVDVPACCVDEQPCITWRQGIGKRQIATICWECCDHQVKVIITGRGKVRVRD